MTDSKSGRYNNLIKASSRGWIWNQLLKRLPQAKMARQEARVFTLIGETTNELEVACKKGFSPFNVIGVDLKEENVKMWRKAGGLAVQLPLDLAVLASKIKPHAVICDYCGGITSNNFHTLWICYMQIQSPGALVVNMLRGRDKVKDFRDWRLKVVMEYLNLDPLHRGQLLYANLLVDSWAEWHSSINGFKKFVDSLNDKIQPAFQTYKSPDGYNQLFDTMVLSMPEALRLDAPQALDDIADKWLKDRIKKSKDLKVMRKMAAMEAVRTSKLNKNNGRLTKQLVFGA